MPAKQKTTTEEVVANKKAAAQEPASTVTKPEVVETPEIAATPVITAQPISAAGATGQADPTISPQPISGQVIANPVSDSVTPLSPEDQGHEPDHSTTRWIVIIVVLLLLIVALLAGGFYYLTQYGPAAGSPPVSPQSLDATESTNSAMTETMGDEQTEALEVVQESDTVEAIETDLNETDLDNIDQELEQIEGEI